MSLVSDMSASLSRHLANILTVYIFVGTILLDGSNILCTIMGSAIGLVGLAYIVAEFIPSIEPPSNMREADAGWGTEGEYTQA